MKFKYTAKNSGNKTIEGTEEASGTAELLQILAKKSLIPVSITTLKGKAAISSRKKSIRGKITLTDQVFLSKYISIMLKVGTDLFQAINILIVDFKRPGLKSLLTEIRDSLEKGQPFYSTFAKYPEYFSPVFINLVKSGESSGTLEQVFSDLHINLSKEKALRAKIRGALMYPSILLSLSFLILIFLMTFALPRLAEVFGGGGFDPPTFSKIVFGIGLFINAHIIPIVSIVLGLVLFLIIFIRSRAGLMFFRHTRVKIPVIRKIIHKLALQRFASTLSSLLKAGLPIMEALDITADAVNHPEIAAGILRAKENVSKGISLGDAFRQEKSFPLVATNLIAISEKSGQIDDILNTLAEFYEGEIDSEMKRAVSLIEPILLPLIGLIIGAIAIAIIIPIYQLVGQL